MVKEKDLIKRESVKTTDYTFNSYIATRSKEQDGYLGVFTDEQGNLLESAMANVGVLLKNGQVLIPPFTHTIAGTTAIKIMKFLKEEGIEIIQEL